MNQTLIVAAVLVLATAAMWLARARLADNPAMRLLSTVGILHNPGHIAPGLDGVHESQRQSFQVGGAQATHQFTFPLEGAYQDLAALATVPGAWISAQSGGSASTRVDRVTIDQVSLDQVLVTCELDAAPGVGETTTIACSLQVAGKAAR